MDVDQKMLLLIESDEADAQMILKMLREADSRRYFLIEAVDTLACGIKRVDDADIVLINLSLPDSRGINTFRSISKVTDVPIVVLTNEADEKEGFKAMQEGAQDCLVIGHFTAKTLHRSIMYAIERHRRQLAESRLGEVLDVLGSLRKEVSGLTIAVKGCREVVTEMALTQAARHEY